MAKGLAVLFTFIFLGASLIVLAQYNNTSMASTGTGVNISSQYQPAYNASVQTTISAISISHYTVIVIAVSTVLIACLVVAGIVLMKRKMR